MSPSPIPNLVRLELIAAERRHTWLDSAGTEADRGQTDEIQVGVE